MAASDVSYLAVLASSTVMDNNLPDTVYYLHLLHKGLIIIVILLDLESMFMYQTFKIKCLYMLFTHGRLSEPVQTPLGRLRNTFVRSV